MCCAALTRIHDTAKCQLSIRCRWRNRSTRSATQPDAEREVPAHKRCKPRVDFAYDGAGAPLFDEARELVVSIEVPNPGVRGSAPKQFAQNYEFIGGKASHRLAQHPGSSVAPR